MSRRPLSRREREIAGYVFQDTIPYGSVSITDMAGIGGSQFTVSSVGFEDRQPTYKLNVGPICFDDMSRHYSGRLIHELTHVWQSINSKWPAAYLFESAFHQIVDGDLDTYSYVVGKQWDEYNVEQQAALVADWYAKDWRSPKSPRYAYILNNIYQGKHFSG